MEDLTLRFTASDTLIGWGIRTLTWSPYSHVEALVEEKQLDGTVKQKYLSAFPDGVQLKDLDYDTDCEFKFAKVRCTAAQRDIILEALFSQIGRPYDWHAVIGIGFHRDWQDLGQWFCSELITWGVKQGGILLVNNCEEMNRITPRDDFYSPLVEVQ